MPRHDANGRRIAPWLAERLGEQSVIYPGLPSHPQHALAARLGDNAAEFPEQSPEGVRRLD
jgi:cystathionine beta-lyase/cystathionine gamma-synthase